MAGLDSLTYEYSRLPIFWRDLQWVFFSASNEIRFPGQYHDRETGLYYNWHRYYKPTLGRYYQADPIGQEGGINLFTYVANNPVNRIDPSGFTWKTNWDFFWDWVFERPPSQRSYGRNAIETFEMWGSPGAEKMRNDFKKGGCKSTGGKFDTVPAYLLTMGKPWNTSFQVGGFIYTATANWDGTVTYRIYNTASIYSFFLHFPGLPHKPRGGSFPFMGNIEQTFEWTEVNPCGCQ